MRKCENCVDGHYNLSERGEQLYCGDDNDCLVTPYDSCDYHRFIEGMEDSFNCVIYDESYLGKGYFIINIKDNKMTKFIKIYDRGFGGFPLLAIRAYDPALLHEDPDEDYTFINFAFREHEDNELYKVMLNLFNRLPSQTDNVININEKLAIKKDGPISLSLEFKKDNYRDCTDFLDFDLGDDYTCKYYDELLIFYRSLDKISYNPSLSNEECIKLVLNYKQI